MSDYVWNAMALLRDSMLGVVVGTFGTALGLLSLLLVFDPFSLIGLVGGIAFLTGAFAAPFTWWSVRQRRDLTLAPVAVEADATGITITGPSTAGRHDWSVFRRVRETPSAFIFDTGASVAILLTKGGVSESDLARLRLLMVRAGGLRFPQEGAWRRTLAGVAIGLGAAALVVVAPLLLGP